MDNWIENTLAELSLEERVGQMMMVGFDGLEVPPHILEWLSAGRVGSVVLFARNIASTRQVKTLTASLREAAPHPILICADQEGGIVTRLHVDEGFTESPGNMALGAITKDVASGIAARMAQTIAQEMRAVGIDWTLAPCLDVLSNPLNPVVGVRSLGSDPERVAELGRAQIRGFQAGGVAACAKHFPGHGNTHIDSHVDLPTIQAELAALQKHDLIPFQAAIQAGVSTVMSAHIVFPALDPDRPATLSPVIQRELLREQLGFDGVITTDCMEMRAIADRFGTGESTVLAALAGVDSIVHSHTRSRQETAYQAILEAVRSGRLPESRVEESARRLLRLKSLFLRDRLRGWEPLPSEEIGNDVRYNLSLEAARASLVMIRGECPALSGQQVGLIEFGHVVSSEAEESAHVTTYLQSDLDSRVRNLQSVSVSGTVPSDEQTQRAEQVAGRVDVLIIATRNAHLLPKQQALAARLLENATGDRMLVCLRNPWDAVVLDVPNVLATLGDARPSLQAAAEALAGEITPMADLPVPLTV